MMVRSFSAQKAALTRALKIEDPSKRCTAVEREVNRTIADWNSPAWAAVHGTNAWPDDWARWHRALEDVGSRQVI